MLLFFALAFIELTDKAKNYFSQYGDLSRLPNSKNALKNIEQVKNIENLPYDEMAKSFISLIEDFFKHESFGVLK